ncbi:MAG: hypothetical protein KDK37_08310 [Leptospiraceae bacterium]|nr:hypothetical protein [Leptospiraceae bacterium]
MAKKSEKPTDKKSSDSAGKVDLQRILDQLRQLEDANAKLQKEVQSRRKERARLIQDLKEQHKRAGQRVKLLDARIQAGAEQLKQLQGLVARLRELQQQKEALIEKLAIRLEMEARSMAAPGNAVSASDNAGTGKMPAKPANAAVKPAKKAPPASKKAAAGPPSTAAKTSSAPAPKPPAAQSSGGLGSLKEELGALLNDVKNMKRTRVKLEKEIDRLKGD